MGALAAIIRAAGPAFGRGRPPAQQRALRDIAQCRTPALGGSLYRCDACGTLAYRYHSCRNRHCPTCQEDRAQDWLTRTRARLLPCDHYLLTFTLPAPLRAVALAHPEIVYAALLREAATTVQTLAHDRAWVGGTPGILAVLHTWSRTLGYHPHAHLLVTAGGLAPDGTTWVRPAHPRFLVPGYMLSEIFRAKMRTALERAGLARAVDPAVWQQRWTVHVQQMGRGDHAVRYLARYVYRVAVTNERLQRTADGHVTLRYLHARTHETRSLTLPVAAFLARFLPHVLPRGFAKIRAYGLLSASRAAALARVRGLLDLDATRTASTTAEALRDTSHTSPVDGVIDAALRCAACHRGALCLVLRVPRSRAPP
jgi:hypothetical protein